MDQIQIRKEKNVWNAKLIQDQKRRDAKKYFCDQFSQFEEELIEMVMNQVKIWKK